MTAHYASNWCTHGRKQRLSEEWWEESLRPFEPSSQQERDAEEEDILCKQYQQCVCVEYRKSSKNCSIALYMLLDFVACICTFKLLICSDVSHLQQCCMLNHFLHQSLTSRTIHCESIQQSHHAIQFVGHRLAIKVFIGKLLATGWV